MEKRAIWSSTLFFIAALTISTVNIGYAKELVNQRERVTVPVDDADLSSIGATMPYVRYDSSEANIGGGAELKTSEHWALEEIASQASNQSYISLPNDGAYAEWTVNISGKGIAMRYTMPDVASGLGQDGAIDVYVNDKKVKTVDLTSYYMWQYMEGNPNDVPGKGTACFAFDEVHFALDKSLEPGDRICIRSSGVNDLVYGVDFLEIEEIEAPIAQPENSYSIIDYGAVPDDGEDDYEAIVACIADANDKGKDVYIPEGTYHINQIWSLKAIDMKITGAGMWYTNIQFTNSKPQSGGIDGADNGNVSNVEFCNMYINSKLRSRYDEKAVYKCFMGTFGENSYIHDIWEEHFECGFWIADYNEPVDYSDGIVIANCRIRNNFADGVNFCQGTSNSVVYNCSVRNNGDDGLAVWNNDYLSAKDSVNNVFCYNTIEFSWRAGAIAIYGGDGHEIYNNYIRDSFMASGIHLNTTFSGYKFDNTQNIHFANNIIVRCGTSCDSWGSELAAVDIIGDVKNIVFDNTRIYSTQHDGVRVGDNISGVIFNDLYIYGAGIDGNRPDKISVPHRGAAIMNFGGNASITVNNLYLRNIANTNGNFLIKEEGIQINNMVDEGNIGYQIPNYPNAHVQKEEIEEPLEIGDADISPDTCEIPDIIVTDILWEPSKAVEGEQIVFSAVIKNQGNGMAPEGIVNGVQFQVDGHCVVWSDTDTTQLKPGESVTVTANSGPTGSAVWSAVEGNHTILAWVNDTARYAESDMQNNQFTKELNITAEDGVKDEMLSGGNEAEDEEEHETSTDDEEIDQTGSLSTFVVVMVIILLVIGLTMVYLRKRRNQNKG